MATFVMYNAYLTVNTSGTSGSAIDLSDHVRSITLDQSVAMQDDTAMGDSVASNSAGLESWTLTVEFLQDYAASKVDATISGLVGVGKTTQLIFRSDSGSTAVTNPQWTGLGVVESYNPVAGSVGDQSMASVVFQSAGALTRVTS